MLRKNADIVGPGAGGQDGERTMAISKRAAFMPLLLAILMLATSDGALANRFRWAADTDPGTMDPYTRNVTATHSFLANIYEPLVRRGRTLDLEPSLATSWSQVSPELWRFNLRRKVRFHDGSAFTANDVVLSFRRAKGPGSLIAGYFAAVKEIRKVDDFTVEIVTDGPDPILPGNLAVWHIMSRSWAEKNNAVQATDLARNEQSFAATNTNGTGPFRLKRREADVRIELEANSDWWDKPEHNLTEVIFTPIANAAGRTAALLSGEVDMVYTLPLNSVAQVQARPNLRVHQTAETRTMYFAFDVFRDELLDSDVKGKNPFKDMRVRQVMRIAIDAEAIKNVTMLRDLDRAKALMAQAGHTNGFDVRMDCSNDRYVNDEAICLATVNMLARIGIRAKLRAMPFGQYVRLVSPPYESSLSYVGWSASTYDTHNTLLNLLVTRAPGSPRSIFNVGGYSNARVDQLTDLIRVELDQAKRNAMIREALTIVRDDVATIPIIQQVIVWGAKDNVDLVQR